MARSTRVDVMTVGVTPVTAAVWTFALVELARTVTTPDLSHVTVAFGGLCVAVGTLVVASGPNTATPHTTTGDRTVTAGDPLTIDLGVVSQGYYSDVTRTVVVGREPDESFRRVDDTVRRAAREAHETVAAGTPLGEIDRAARSVIAHTGYGKAFPHRVGHGIGLAGHEPPYLAADADEPARVGHAVTVEPGVYLDDGGVRIKDEVVLTPDGLETLTGFSRDLRVV